MENFIQKYQADVTGVLQGFDRLLIRGTIRMLMYTQGLMGFLSKISVRVKDFGEYAQSVTERLREASLEAARRLERPIQYLASAGTDKEDRARQIATRDGLTQGLICVLTAVEPCWSYEIHKNRETGQRELLPRFRKCLHLYHYLMDETFGFMHVRLQTWFPFTIQVCLNGREWLARQMDAHGLAYKRDDNCFTWLEDLRAAQGLMDRLVNLPWGSLLKAMSRRVNPLHDEIFAGTWNDYYWSLLQSEWASDIMFRSPEALNRIYPALLRGAILALSCTDVIRFFGPKVRRPLCPQVTSQYKELPEGLRVKHWMGVNSIKAYNKSGSLLRPETTLNDPSVFKVYRRAESDPNGPLRWLPLRKGLADIARRAEVSQAANERYLDALACLETDRPLRELLEPVCRSVRWRNQRLRGLRPWTSEDRTLLQAANRGEYLLNGFRNRDILRHVYPQTCDGPDHKRRSASITRKVRMLRAHGLIAKISHTHRYRVTPKGREILSALLQCQEVTIKQLNKAAA